MTASCHLRQHCTILILAFTLVALATSRIEAGANPDFRIVLHAKQTSFENCNGYLPVDCVNVQPTVNVQAAPLGVFVLIYNYEAASGLQTALQWTGWSRTFSIWDCLQMCDPGPCPPPINPPGTEIIAVAFTGCVTGPALVSVGRIFFVPAGNAGCITQSDPGLPLGIHLLDCEGGWDQITDPESPRLGKICVNAGGVNACAGAVPVESATWGRIKATY
ncbi:MAG TPA: hypothetical protein VNL97_03765 [Solirubrobacterales bacterium]|nr:hypothetical protein [Candidatus Udaeobacter sp.]HWP32846.1 hypothetical protein [Solirubrobacterales bacterium]